MSHKLKLPDILPEYPSMLHLPWKPNNKGDKVAGWDVADLILGKVHVTTQEKVDGAQSAMAFVEGHPVVRSRSRILRKGQELKNPSQKQFASAWNWMHDNRHKFEWLEKHVGPVSVYGEWMVQQHGMEYDYLPDWFIAYELFDYEKRISLDPVRAANYLLMAGFEAIPIESPVLLPSWEVLEEMANRKSHFHTSARREGVVVKVSDGEKITHRFKMVRQGFRAPSWAIPSRGTDSDETWLEQTSRRILGRILRQQWPVFPVREYGRCGHPENRTVARWSQKSGAAQLVHLSKRADPPTHE